ncbi:MAG: UDP-glucose/GDP-mannose dehydrogenase family protein [Bacteroidota bacterium]
MNIGVIGTGYVGLVAGTCFAESGNDVICMDIDRTKIQKLKRGIVPIYEPGLEELVRRNINEKRLRFTTRLSETVDVSKVIFLALPTPSDHDGGADLRVVLDVVRKIARRMKKPKIIVTKSTVPVGTVDRLRTIMRRETRVEFEVVANPEFLKEGAAVNDFLYPERVIVGTRNKEAAKILHDLYAPFMRTADHYIVMDERSAELTKYAANSLLATKISFMNEVANLAERVGADIDMVRLGIGSDSRIGPQFLFPGVGYGGSCFPKDVKALIKTSQEQGYESKILKAVDGVNEQQKLLLVEKFKAHFKGKVKDRLVAIWGLAYKPRTDDLRDAPSLVIISHLLEAGARVNAHDPVANERAKEILGEKIHLFDNNYDVLKGADALIVVTEWNEFRQPDFVRMKRLMKSPVIFDGRNIYDAKEVRARGFTYYGIGR